MYPDVFGNQYKEAEIAKHVSDLSGKWWHALVSRIILSSNPRLDIEAASRGERLAKQNHELTLETLKASENIKMSDDGLDVVLKKLGAKSLLDAIEKKS